MPNVTLEYKNVYWSAFVYIYKLFIHGKNPLIANLLDTLFDFLGVLVWLFCYPNAQKGTINDVNNVNFGSS